VVFLKKGPAIGDGLQLIRGYFSEVLIELNLAFRVVPRPLTTAMIARAIPAAIKPYSMAVAADSSRTKRAKSLVICDSRERKSQSNAHPIAPQLIRPIKCQHKTRRRDRERGPQ
jgi:hypothetical protein